MAQEPVVNPAGDMVTRPVPWRPPVKLIVLTGFMGAGKSTVGRELAARISFDFVDLDDSIEAKAHDSISRIFATFGEPHFRRLEHEALREALRPVELATPAVIALGGGTIAQPENLSLLAASECPIVFLDAPLEELAWRCGRATNRPLFRSEDEFRALYRRRLPFYLHSHLRIDTSGKSSFQIAEEIASSLGLEVTR